MAIMTVTARSSSTALGCAASARSLGPGVAVVGPVAVDGGADVADVVVLAAGPAVVEGEAVVAGPAAVLAGVAVVVVGPAVVVGGGGDVVVGAVA